MNQQLSEHEWQSDLDFMVETLQNTHPNPFTKISRAEFEEAVARLRRRMGDLPRHAILVELKRLLASIRDGHSSLPLSSLSEFRSYPLRLYVYEDGLHISAASSEHGQLAGARVLAIGETPADEAYAAVRDLVSYDNEMGVKATAPSLLLMPEVLHALGMVGVAMAARWELETPSGERLSVELEPADMAAVRLVDARDSASAPTPLYLRDPASKFWFEYMESERTLYVQLNAIRDKEDETITGFYDRVFAFIDKQQVERLVLDIRLNGGGNNYLNQSLVHNLIRCDKVNQPGRLFTIIGRRTFSAAMNLTNDLERHTRTIFAGEPTGSSPNHFGDAKDFKLPSSGAGFRISTLYWQYSDPDDNRPWVAPELPAPLTSADYRANRDPALKAILAHVPGSLTVDPFPDRRIKAIERQGGS